MSEIVGTGTFEIKNGSDEIESDEELTLEVHEKHSEERAAYLASLIKTKIKEEAMSEPVNVFTNGNDSNAGVLAAIAAMGNNRGYAPSGDGFGGGGVMGAVLAASLFGRNGFDGCNGGDSCLPNQLNSVADGINHNINTSMIGLGNQVSGGFTAQNTSAILQSIGDTKAQVGLSACEVMGTVTNAAADITNQTLQQTIGLTNQINDAKSAGVGAAATNALLLTNGFAQVGDKVDTLATATAVGFGNVNFNIERTAWQTSQVTRDDGDKTRALIVAQYEATLNRQLSDANNVIAELRSEQRRQQDRHGIEINMTNNQNQNQLQFQAQQQVLANLANCIHDVSQVARATNQQLIIGNAGAVTGGAQTANPTNVRA